MRWHRLAGWRRRAARGRRCQGARAAAMVPSTARASFRSQHLIGCWQQTHPRDQASDRSFIDKWLHVTSPQRRWCQQTAFCPWRGMMARQGKVHLGWWCPAAAEADGRGDAAAAMMLSQPPHHQHTTLDRARPAAYGQINIALGTTTATRREDRKRFGKCDNQRTASN